MTRAPVFDGRELFMTSLGEKLLMKFTESLAFWEKQESNGWEQLL